MVLIVSIVAEDKNNKLMSSEGMEATEQEMDELVEEEGEPDSGAGIDLGFSA